jgi:hypothetical protein
VSKKDDRGPLPGAASRGSINSVVSLGSWKMVASPGGAFENPEGAQRCSALPPGPKRKTTFGAVLSCYLHALCLPSSTYILYFRKFKKKKKKKKFGCFCRSLDREEFSQHAPELSNRYQKMPPVSYIVQGSTLSLHLTTPTLALSNEEQWMGIMSILHSDGAPGLGCFLSTWRNSIPEELRWTSHFG